MKSLTQKTTVSIEFHGTQRILASTDGIVMPITGRTTVNDALGYVRQKYPALSLEDGMILATVNLENSPLDRVLKENDSVSFLPIIGGG
jgi:molybdopterin converting factor small subunit